MPNEKPPPSSASPIRHVLQAASKTPAPVASPKGASVARSASASSPPARDGSSSASDRVDLTHLDDDERADPRGTTISRPDGTTVTHTPDGKTTVEYERDGQQVSETTYNDDGTEVHEQTVHNADGSTHAVSTRSKDGLVETTTRDTHRTDEDLSTFVDGPLRDQLEQAPRVQSDGKRAPTEVTTVNATVTDTRQDPPVTRKIAEGAVYTQASKADAYSADRLLNPGIRSHELDEEASGQTLAYSRMTTFGADGKPTVSEQLAARGRIAAKPDDDGQVYAIDSGFVCNAANGRLTDKTQWQDDPAASPNLGGLPAEYSQRLEAFGQPVRHASQSTTTYDSESNANVTTAEIFSTHLDHPERDGVTVAQREQNGATLLDFTRVSGDGAFTDSQTSIRGTLTRLVSHQERLPDGGFTRATRLQNGNDAPSYSSNERYERVAPDQVNVDGAYRDAFLSANGGAPVYRYSQSVEDAANGTRTEGSSYFGAHGASVTQLTNTDSEGNHTFTTLEAPSSDHPFKAQGDGVTFALDRDGELSANGQSLGHVRTHLDDVDRFKEPAGSTGKEVSKLLSAELDLKDTWAKVKTSGSGVLSTVGFGMAGYSLVQSMMRGDAVEGIDAGGKMASSLGEISALGGRVFSESAAASALGIGGKALGAAGAIVGAGLGVYEITQGNVADGAADIAVGVGGAMAATGVGAPLGVVLMGGGLVTKLVIDWPEMARARQMAPLEI